MTQPRRTLRVFIYAQHLSGVGHMVRSQQIGLALAARHRVSILDGGRTLPFPAALHRVQVPRIARGDGGFVTLDGCTLPHGIWRRRGQLMRKALAQQPPDVVVVEHFPFSKWELGDEIDAMLAFAKQINPAVKTVASLRDISLRTRFEQQHNYESTVQQLLHRYFEALLVHADSGLCQLGDYFGGSQQIEIPVFHTGVVAADIQPFDTDIIHALVPSGRYIVASTGGGADAAQLLTRVARAWVQLSSERAVGSYKLLLFSGLQGYPQAARELMAGQPSLIPMGFDPDFKRWLHGAALSISCAGYNTCANLLVAHTPALLMPNTAMSDQQERARLLAGAGVASCVPPATEEGDPLAELIAMNLERDRTHHHINTDGAVESARRIEQLVSGLPSE